ncbi:hypothetical protein DFS33DRAFT_792557 [Desarmillaria ectypa]|nr:hypothetical protein DFS33DRAFT_792557 [Desarmillaria ectypa]
MRILVLLPSNARQGPLVLEQRIHSCRGHVGSIPFDAFNRNRRLSILTDDFQAILYSGYPQRKCGRGKYTSIWAVKHRYGWQLMTSRLVSCSAGNLAHYLPRPHAGTFQRPTSTNPDGICFFTVLVIEIVSLAVILGSATMLDYLARATADTHRDDGRSARLL